MPSRHCACSEVKAGLLPWLLLAPGAPVSSSGGRDHFIVLVLYVALTYSISDSRTTLELILKFASPLASEVRSGLVVKYNG